MAYFDNNFNLCFGAEYNSVAPATLHPSLIHGHVQPHLPGYTRQSSFTNAGALDQPRAELGLGKRFQPYGIHARPTKHANATAAPLQPSGGLTFETVADAENQTNAEENWVQEPKRTRAPRGQGKHRKHRAQLRSNAPVLLKWAQKRAGLQDPPTFNGALAIAAEAIGSVRGVVNEQPCLLITNGKDPGAASEGARKERERRSAERGLFQKLSRYYPREKGVWTRPQLLSNVVQDLEAHPALQETPTK